MRLALIALLPFLGAVLPPLLIRAGRDVCALTTGAITLTSLALLLIEAPAVFRGEVPGASFVWIAQLGLNFSFFVDGLGFLFAFLILTIGLLIIIYARFYLDKADPMGRFYSYLLLFQGAMLGIVLADNILLLVVFWELTSLSSFLLIGYWRHLPEGRQGARMALVVTGAGGLSMLGGTLLLGHVAGSYELTTILARGEAIRSSALYLPALLLILGGAFTKSAQFPFHFWLPHAMAAPTPVSAYLHSATMVKAGIFLLARIWPALAGTEAWFLLVTGAGLVTMLIAAWIAIFKDDLKALLAFSTVSHLGLITMLLGFGTPLAAMAAVFHIINHATFKCALFMTAGIVDHEAGTRDARRLGGLIHLMPITATLALVAAASMGGLPPLNGFISKEMMLEEAVHTVWADRAWVVPALATLAALFSTAYSARYAFHVFLGRRRNEYPHAPHEPPPGMWLPVACLVSFVVLIGLFPEIVAGPMVRLATAATTGGQVPEYELALWHGVTPALLMSMVAVGGGLVLIAAFAPVRTLHDAVPRPEAKRIFEGLIEAAATGAQRLIEPIHNGSVQRSLVLIAGAAAVIGIAGFLGGGYAAGLRPTMPANLPALAGWVLVVGAAGALALLHRHRLLTLILTSVVGLIVSMAFLYLSAPDLALTQISVEVVTTILLLLALNFLPKTTPVESSRARRMRDALVSIVAGAGVTALVWAVTTRDVATISGYHVEQSKPGGGGTNIVNVILVDFRGYDTFGEIIVLAIAALVIFALLDGALRGPAGRRLANWVADQPRAADRHPLMLVVATRVMLPLALMVGVYILLRGHNLPGGGFIAALVVAVALLMQYLASGFSWAQERLPIDFHALTGGGVLIAAITGVAAWLFGAPFLTSTYGYIHLPMLGEIELASAMAFDLGVFLAVLGAVMVSLANLSRVLRRSEREPPSDSPMDYAPPKQPAEV
jgi:multicomponent K+:H+ antiporter subunit A